MGDVSVNNYKLMRAREGRMVGGVAAGLARASGMDVTLVRLCIGATMLSGFGIVAYILMCFIVPEEAPKRGRVIEPAPESTARGIRIVLVALGALSLVNKAGGFWPFADPHARGVGSDGALGFVLLGVGIAILFSRHRPDRALWEPATTATTPAAPTATAEYAPPVATAAASTDSYYGGDGYDYQPAPSPEADLAPRPVATVTGETTPSGGVALGWARVVGWLAIIWWSLAAIGLTALYAIGAVHITAPGVLFVAMWFAWTAVTNTLFHARFARAIVPSLALLLIPVAIGAATVRANGEVGQVISAPSTIAQSTKNYRLAAGRLDLKFADTTFTHDTTINARTGAGAIFVVVPDDVAVKVNVHSRTGAYEVFGQESHGISPNFTRNFKGCEGAKHLTLNLRTGAGYVQVHRASGRSIASCYLSTR